MMAESTIVIGESRLFREALTCLLSSTPYKVTAVGAIGATSKILEEADDDPQLVLFGLQPNDEGLEPLTKVRRRFPDSRIVVLTSTPNKNLFIDCLGAGVNGYLLMDISAEVLFESLRLVMLGEKVFPTILAAWIVDDNADVFAGSSDIGAKLLSGRELEILSLIIEGDSNKIIANKLKITEGTVKIHVRRILKKIHASNRTQAAVWAVNHGLAPIDCSVGQQDALVQQRGINSETPPSTRIAG